MVFHFKTFPIPKIWIQKMQELTEFCCVNITNLCNLDLPVSSSRICSQFYVCPLYSIFLNLTASTAGVFYLWLMDHKVK